MKFGPTPISEAEHGILAHSLRLPDGSTLSKGTVLGDDALRALERAGLAEVVVAHVEPDEVTENEAARDIARALEGVGIEAAAAGAGRCNLRAKSDGLLRIDGDRIHAANRVDEAIAISTRPPDTPVRRGDLVACVKILPFGVPDRSVRACSDRLQDGALAVQAYTTRSIAFLTSEPDWTKDLGSPGESSVRRQLEQLGVALNATFAFEHEVDACAEMLEHAAASGHDLLIVLGRSAIADRGDVLPRAVCRAGGTIDRFGIPVDPGQLTLLARLNRATVLGMPGCAVSPRENGFDRILPWTLTGWAPDDLPVSGLGVGGLLK